MICDLPDDLLLRILFFVPTKDAFATSTLSKRWRFLWTMLPEFEFNDEGSETIGGCIDKALQLHKAPKLECLTVELGPRCPVDVDVRNWVETAVNRGVELLYFDLLWTAEPTSFPKSLYTCDTLVGLTLSNQILVDVSSPASLPSLLHLNLANVVYKDEDSFVRLLSSSPFLETLFVERHGDDNLKNVTVKVPSLQVLHYYSMCNDNEDEVEDDQDKDEDGVEADDVNEVVLEDQDKDEDGVEVEVDDVDEDEVEEDDDDDDDDELIGSLVIDSPALIEVDLVNAWAVHCLIENMPCLDVAYIDSNNNNPDDKILRSLSSVIHLHLSLTKSMVAYCNAIRFSRLIEFCFCPDKSVDWLEPLMFFLQNSPKLETLMISSKPEGPPLSCRSQLSTIPGCLLSHLQIFGWSGYGGREDEKQLVRYILANSKCLTTVKISPIPTCNLEETKKELKSMPRISTSSQLLVSTKMKWMFNGKNLSEYPALAT